MSEFRHGRRFISRDPLREERWNAEHESRARRYTHGRNVGTAATQSNDAPHWSTGFSSSLHPHPSSSPPCRRQAADCYTFRLPSDHNNGVANPAARSRDRSVLRSAVTTKTKLCSTNERRMTEEIGFRPIFRRHSESNSSSENEPASQKDLSSSTSKTKKPYSLCPVNQGIQPMNQVGSQSGTFLTLPANADSMHVQIKDTKISITRIHDVPSLDCAARRISAEYDNCPELENGSMKTGEPVSSTKIFPVPAASVFRTSDYQPTQRSPVRGLRLVPSPNSAFTKTRPTIKASEDPETIQLQTNSLKSASKTSDHENPAGNSCLIAKTDFSQFDDSWLSQTPVDFVQLLYGFWMRPADIDQPRSFKSQQKSCSLDSLVSDGIGKENSAKNDSKYAFRKPQPLILKNANDSREPPTSAGSLNASTYISQLIQPISKDSSDRKFRNASLETDLQSPTEIANDIPTAWNSKPDLYENQKSLNLAQKTFDTDRSSFVLQPKTGSLANVSFSLPITDTFSNLLTATLKQPMGFSLPCQPTLKNSVCPITTASVDLNKSEATPIAFSNADQRPMTTTANDAIDVSTQELPSVEPSSLCSVRTPSKDNDLLHSETSHESSAIASAMHNLEKAIFMLNSFAMEAKTPVAPVTILSTMAKNTESLVKSFQSDGGGGTVPDVDNDTSAGKNEAAQIKERMLEEQSKVMESEFDIALKHLTLDITEQSTNRIRKDAVLTITLNLLDQTLAEIHQEFPPGQAVETKSRSKSSGTDFKEPHRSLQPPETKNPFCETPLNTTSLQRGSIRQSGDEPLPAAMSLDPSASDQNRGFAGAEPQPPPERVVDRQDSFNRPGSSLYGEPLPLPKVSVIRRHRRKKKNKKKSSTSPSSASTSSSSSAEEAITEPGNSTSTTSGNGAVRSTRSIQRPARRQKPAKRLKEGGASVDDVIDVDDRTKTSCRFQRDEGNAEGHTRSAVAVVSPEQRGLGEAPPRTVVTKVLFHNRIDDGKTSIDEAEPRRRTTLRGAETTRRPGEVVDVSVEVPIIASTVTPSATTGKHTASSVDNDDGGKSNNSNNNNHYDNDASATAAGDLQSSPVGKDFRKLEEEEESEEEFHDSHSRLSSASLPLVSESSPTAMHSPSFEQLRNCRSCSSPEGPHATGGRTQAVNRCSPLRQPPEHGSTVPKDGTKKDSGSSLERLSYGSQDDVFQSPVNQPGNKVAVEKDSMKDGPDTAATPKESCRPNAATRDVVISGAHGCSSYRTDAAAAAAADGLVSLAPVRGGGEAERVAGAGGGGGGGLFTGSAQLTLKQKRQGQKEPMVFEIPVTKSTAPHRLVQLSSRTTSSGDNDNDDNVATTRITTTTKTMATTPIQAQSKAVSYESICLKVHPEDAPPEVPKTIHILTSGQTSGHRAHCFKPALPEAKEEEEKEKGEEKGEMPSLHPKCQNKEAANHLSVIASFSLEQRPMETKTDLQSEITDPVHRRTRARLPNSDGNEPPRSAQRELILQLNVLPGSAPAGVKDDSQHGIIRERLHQNKSSAPKDGCGKQTAVSFTLDNGVVKKVAKSEALEGNVKRNSELEMARNRLASIVSETPATKVSRRKHLFEQESNPTCTNRFIMGTVFIDRNKAQPPESSSSGKTESLSSENSRRIEEKRPTTTGRFQQPLACTLHLVPSTVKSTNDGGGSATKEETTTNIAATTTTTAATTTGSQEHATRAATLPEIASAGISEADQQQQQQQRHPAAGLKNTSSQFLCTVSKFSQPLTTASLIGRLNPVSRVSWAKQRFGDAPSANARPSTANNRRGVVAAAVTAVASRTFPGASSSSSLDRSTKREDQPMPSYVDRSADRCPLLKKSNVSIALEYSGKKKDNSTSESTATTSAGKVYSFAPIDRSRDIGGVVFHQAAKEEDRLQNEGRSLGVSVSVEKSNKEMSNVDGKTYGSGITKRLNTEDGVSVGVNLSATENVEAASCAKAEKPETLNLIPDARARNHASISLLNKSSDRFQLSSVEASGSSDVTRPAKTSVDDVRIHPPDEDTERPVSASGCTGVNGSSIQSEPTAAVVVYADVEAPPVANITLNPIPEEEVKESRDQGQRVVQKKTAGDSDRSPLLELKATAPEQLDSPLTDVDLQGNVSKCSISSETPKQDLLSSERGDNKEEHEEQEPEEPEEQEQEQEDASSLVDLSEDRPDEEASGGESSHCSMEVIGVDDDGGDTASIEVDPLAKKSENLPSSARIPNLDKGPESSSSSSSVRLRDEQQRSTPGPEDGDVAASSYSLDRPTSPAGKKGPPAAKPCIVRRQLIQLDSALHPSSCVQPTESKPVPPSKWSPKLVRKLHLADARDVDVSDLGVDPKLMDFLSRQIDRSTAAAAEKPGPARDGDGKEKTTAAGDSCSSRPTAETATATPCDKSAARKPAVPTEAEKPEGEVEKRKFFSALKANAASFRAKMCAGGEENRSQEGLQPLDRLTSFAIISDVGIGAKRRQFQNVIGTTATGSAGQSTADPHSSRPATSGSSADEKKKERSKPGIFVPSHDDVTAKEDTCAGSAETPVESKTRQRRQKKADDDDDDDDDDFDRLVAINFRQLVEERAAAGKGDQSARTRRAPSKAGTKVKASVSFNRSVSTDRTSSDRTKSSAAAAAAAAAADDDDDRLSLNTEMTNDLSRSSLDEKCKLLREKLKVGSESALKLHGSRRQLPRFKTQPVTFDEVEKAFEKALHHDDS